MKGKILGVLSVALLLVFLSSMVVAEGTDDSSSTGVDGTVAITTAAAGVPTAEMLAKMQAEKKGKIEVIKGKLNVQKITPTMVLNARNLRISTLATRVDVRSAFTAGLPADIRAKVEARAEGDVDPSIAARRAAIAKKETRLATIAELKDLRERAKELLKELRHDAKDGSDRAKKVDALLVRLSAKTGELSAQDKTDIEAEIRAERLDRLESKSQDVIDNATKLSTRVGEALTKLRAIIDTMADSPRRDKLNTGYERLTALKTKLDGDISVLTSDLADFKSSHSMDDARVTMSDIVLVNTDARALFSGLKALIGATNVVRNHADVSTDAVVTAVTATIATPETVDAAAGEEAVATIAASEAADASVVMDDSADDETNGGDSQ